MMYYLPKDYKIKRINDAGSKARWDIEDIMAQMGISPIGRHHGISHSRIHHFFMTLMSVIRIALRINHGNILILQYPVKYYAAICRIAHIRRARIISFVHDLYCFRLKRHSIHKEIELMNLSDALVCCNPTICQWMSANGFVGHNGKGITTSMGVFDFFSKAKCMSRQEQGITHKIAYAGQLSIRKNKFLYSFGHHIHNFRVNVYGKGFNKADAAAPEKFEVKGFMLPDELIGCADGDFGLVWDGDSAECCNGDWGEYLTFNTPHKISLYIRCGLPLIVWNKAAMADFVKENGIGICIDSLRDIDEIYEHLTQEEYNKMCDNILRINQAVSKGEYFRNALSEAISLLTQV